MADVIKQVGHIDNGNEVMIRVISSQPPFTKPSCQLFEEYKVGVDFQSGDNLKLQFKSITKIFAVATTPTGAIIPYTQTALSGQWSGIELTFNNVTTDFKLFAITDL